MESTFVLTADLDQESFAWLDTLRREHFPPHRNVLPAHLTLFHRLSSEQAGRLTAIALPTAPLPVIVDAPILLGSGVAFRVLSPDLERLREHARETMGGPFSRQDNQPWRPHVTIQNKTTASAALRLFRQIEDDFKPRSGSVSGLLVWEYLGGPWELVERLNMRAG